MSEDLFERLINDYPGMAYRCLHDANWTLEFVSAGSTALLGFTPKELVVEKKVAISDLVLPEDLAGVSLAVERGVSAREPFTMTYRMRTAEGQVKHISEVGRGLFGPAGELLALEGFLSDVTQQVETKRALQIAEKREELGRLAGGVAHDLNNMLTAIYGATHALRNSLPAGSEERAHVETVELVAKRAEQLSKQLLVLGRPQPTIGGIATRRVDLSRILDEQVRLLRRLVGPQVELRVSGSPDPLPAEIDSVSFEQAVLNLVLNARDAIESKGTIDIRLERIGEKVRLEVQDDGPGIPDDVAKQIFDPFFTTKRGKSKGNGLGLTIVHDVVQGASGTISLQTSQDGTTFCLEWPLARHVVPDSTSAPLGNEVVLLAEDDAAIREALARDLRRLGYEVLEANDGLRGIELCDRHKGPIDILVTDGNMPGANGHALATGFRKHHPKSPRLLITGDGVQPGELFSALLRKPFLADELAVEIRRLLDAAKGASD